MVPSDLPEAVRGHAELARTGRLPLGLAVHHSVGGVAVDTWGRTSVPGLYACGEAAGGVQGARRTMGTGLLEARVFGVRAGRAVVRDGPRLLGRVAAGSVAPEVPAQPEELKILLDRELSALAGLLFPEGVHRLHQVLQDWPIGAAGEYDELGAAAAAIRRRAVHEVLESARRVESLQQGVGDGA
jgi:L-aspartate oxidase